LHEFSGNRRWQRGFATLHQPDGFCQLLGAGFLEETPQGLCFDDFENLVNIRISGLEQNTGIQSQTRNLADGGEAIFDRHLDIHIKSGFKVYARRAACSPFSGSPALLLGCIFSAPHSPLRNQPGVEKFEFSIV
jgi:hypothetical protein